jgi:hypothetical protein
LRAFEKPMPKRMWSTPEGVDRSRPEGFLRRRPRANAPGREAYVPTLTCFGKARERSFRDFMTAKRALSRKTGPPGPLLPGSPQKPSLGTTVLEHQPWNTSLGTIESEATHASVAERAPAERPGGCLSRQFRAVADRACANTWRAHRPAGVVFQNVKPANTPRA